MRWLVEWAELRSAEVEAETKEEAQGTVTDGWPVGVEILSVTSVDDESGGRCGMYPNCDECGAL